MIRVVLDVNVIVSAFPYQRGNAREIIDRWAAQEFTLVTSDHILSGVRRAWNNDFFRRQFSPEFATQAAELLLRSGTSVTPVTDVRGVADDEEDDLVLATAVAGQADCLVTGDLGLLRLGSYEGIPIVSPRDFLALLDARSRVDPT